MKKWIALLLAAMLLLAVGFYAGFHACDNARKYVSFNAGMPSIVTVFAGHEYEYVLRKESELNASRANGW